MRNLTGIVFEDGLCGFAGRNVKKHDRCHVFPEWFSNTTNLLCQYPHANAVMASAEAKIDQLARAAFLRLSKQHSHREQRVCLSSQRSSWLVLANFRSHEDARVFVHEAVVGRILNKGGTKEHNVVKLPPEGTTQLV